MKLKKTASLKAFTLVELIVVMIILAILMALMLPSLTKYIDKADYQSLMVEAKAAYTAAQTAISETYGTAPSFKPNSVNYHIPQLNEDGTIKKNSSGDVMFADKKCARLTNGTFCQAQKTAIKSTGDSGTNPNIEGKLATTILEYLDSFDTKYSKEKDKGVSHYRYDFTKSEERIDYGYKKTADDYFKNSNGSEVAFTVYYDAAKGKVLAIYFAKKGCDKIAVVTSNDIALIDRIT